MLFLDRRECDPYKGKTNVLMRTGLCVICSFLHLYAPFVNGGELVMVGSWGATRMLFEGGAEVFDVAVAATLGDLLLRIILRFEQRDGVIDADGIKIPLGACTEAFVKFSSQICLADKQLCRNLGNRQTLIGKMRL